jgi:hypothetical protein
MTLQPREACTTYKTKLQHLTELHTQAVTRLPVAYLGLHLDGSTGLLYCMREAEQNLQSCSRGGMARTQLFGMVSRHLHRCTTSSSASSSTSSSRTAPSVGLQAPWGFAGACLAHENNNDLRDLARHKKAKNTLSKRSPALTYERQARLSQIANTATLPST